MRRGGSRRSIGAPRNFETGYVRQATVGKWGKNLAIRFPGALAKATRLRDGERVEIEARDRGWRTGYASLQDVT